LISFSLLLLLYYILFVLIFLGLNKGLIDVETKLLEVGNRKESIEGESINNNNNNISINSNVKQNQNLKNIQPIENYRPPSAQRSYVHSQIVLKSS
jgi:hypothetical protein